MKKDENLFKIKHKPYYICDLGGYVIYKNLDILCEGDVVTHIENMCDKTFKEFHPRYEKSHSYLPTMAVYSNDYPFELYSFWKNYIKSSDNVEQIISLCKKHFLVCLAKNKKIILFDGFLEPF